MKATSGKHLHKVATERHGRHTVHDVPLKDLGDDLFYINQYLLDEESEFCGRVVGRSETSLNVLDLGRERLMNMEPGA